MNISHENIRRISALPKAIIAEVLIIVADIIADFDAQNDAHLMLKTTQVDAQNTQNDAQNDAQTHVKGGIGGLLTSSKTKEDREVSRKEDTALIGKLSTRKPCAREGFDEFWQAYPRRVNKQAAIRKFEFVIKSGVEKQRIINAVNLYATSVSSTEKKYIKAPDAWLHKGCYDDELLPLTNGYDAQCVKDIRTNEQIKADWARTMETLDVGNN